jgi:hypothetical protein
MELAWRIYLTFLTSEMVKPLAELPVAVMRLGMWFAGHG